MSLPTFGVGGTTSGSAGGAFAIQSLSTATAGQYALAWLVDIASTGTYTLSSPSGTWTKILAITGSNSRLTLWGQLLAAGDVAGSLTFSPSAIKTYVLGWETYNNCGGVGNAVGVANGASTTSCVAPACGPVSDTSLMVAGCSTAQCAALTGTWTLAATFTSRETIAVNVTDTGKTLLQVADRGANSSAAFTASGPSTFTSPQSGDAISIMAALSPTVITLGATGSATVTLGATANLGPLTPLNPSWPQVITEIGFDQGPNSGIEPFWTDVSDRSESVTATRGQQYELASPSPGSGSFSLRNNDGAFNPVNTSSPFYPHVLPMRRARITALWANVSYRIWSGFVRVWPQGWDTSRFGHSSTQTVDALATLQATMLPTAAAAANASDPVHLWQLDENQTTPVGFTAVTWTFADQGSAPNNLSVSYGANHSETLTAGASLPTDPFGLPAADTSEGVRFTPTAPPINGAYSIDATTSDALVPLAGNTVTVEAWFAAFSSATLTNSAVVYSVDNGTSYALQLAWQVASPTQINFTLTIGSTSAGLGQIVLTQADLGGALGIGTANHIVVTLDGTLGGADLFAAVWVNGTLHYARTVPVIYPTSAIFDRLHLGGDPLASHFYGDQQIIAMAIYHRFLTQAEIADHYSAYTGDPGDLTGTRMGRLLAWAGWNGAASLDAGSSTMQPSRAAGGTLISGAQQIVDTEVGELSPTPPARSCSPGAHGSRTKPRPSHSATVPVKSPTKATSRSVSTRPMFTTRFRSHATWVRPRSRR